MKAPPMQGLKESRGTRGAPPPPGREAFNLTVKEVPCHRSDGASKSVVTWLLRRSLLILL
jgi:hypothetical protein